MSFRSSSGRTSFVLLSALALLASCSRGAPLAAPALHLSPSAITLGPGATAQFSADATAAPAGALHFSVVEPTGGTIDASGLYTAPSIGGVFHVSVALSSGAASDRATVTILPPPAIATFTAAPASVAPGQSATLAWSAAGATAVSIDQGVGAVGAAGTIAVSPSSTTTYTLTATNASGSVTSKTTVTVSPIDPPVISSFSAAPTAIARGQASTLAWEVTGATSVAINQGVGQVAASGSAGVSPLATTIYTLTAVNSSGTVTATASVSVLQKPTIFAFAASPLTINPGGSSMLSWQEEGAATLSVDHGAIVASGASSTTVSPATTTVYTLTATNAAGSTAAMATVTVVAPGLPIISAFTATPTSINSGQSSTLAWTVAGATTLTLDNSIGVVSALTSKTVSPTASTTYRLTATNAVGSTSATVSVGVKPVINNFSAAPGAIAVVDPLAASALSWNVGGATSLSIDGGVGTVTGATGTKSIAPTATTTYTLTATNASGSSIATATVTLVSITSFTATPAPAAAGAAVTLSWAASGATAYSIDNGVGAVTGTSAIVHPSSSATYRLTASNGAAAAVSAVTVTVNPAAPHPLVSSFSSDLAYVLQGSGTTLRWVTNGASVSIDNGIGSISGATGSVAIAPATTTTYTLTSINGSGSNTAAVTVSVGPAAASYLAPGDPGGAPAVTLTLDARQAVHPISRFVYGYNASLPSQAPPATTYLRQGGNRWTAYNWETNASNAGSDFFYESDSFLSSSSTPAAALSPTVAADQAASVGSLLTLPLQGWVSADESGPVSTTAAPALRFFQTLPRKGAPLSSSPSTADSFVYQDEYANTLLTQYPGAFTDALKPIHFELDNEPDLWSSTHAEIQRASLTYGSLLRSSTDLSSAIKDLIPQALVFGPVSYGFNGYINLQGASDADATAWNPPATATWFLDSYLQKMRTASEAQGRRLLDVLDLHWYSEGQGQDQSGAWIRVNNSCATCNDPGMQAARIQSPRSLWDPTYTCATAGTAPASCEHSWIANYFDNWASGANAYGPIQLIAWLRTKIGTDWPGTRIAFTEYNHGGADDISGGLAQADTLGIFGRESVYAATFWPLISDNRFVFGAYRSFRDYDGAGGAFGDQSFSALSTDDSRASVYASFDSASPNARVVVVAINKTTAALQTQLKLTYPRSFTKAHAWQLTATSAYTSPSVIPTALADITLTSTNAFNVTLPAYSVTTFVLIP